MAAKTVDVARPNKPARELASLEECTIAMGDLLVARLEVEALVTERDLAVAAAQSQFEARLDAARADSAALEAALQAYYYAHVAEIEMGGRKSVQLGNGVFGRRDNPPALRPLNKKWTWGSIAAAVRGKWGLRYFRTPEPELDKDALKTLDEERLKSVGLRLESKEIFYAEPARLPAEGDE